jgi:para-aminobenzoate synthetase component 1
MKNKPLTKELPFQDPHKIFAQFAAQKNTIFLDSATADETLTNTNRYSFIGLDPYLIISSKNGHLKKNDQSFLGCPFDELTKELNRFILAKIPGLPPFQGGAAGYFSYELYQHLEEIPFAKKDDADFADMTIGFYDLIISFDHQLKKSWIIATGLPQQTEENRILYAQNRINDLTEKLNHISNSPTIKLFITPKITTDLSQQQYQELTKKVLDYIFAGDIFEANLSQRFATTLPNNLTTFYLYTRLRKINPAPFAAYLNFSDTVLSSASPERFIQLTENNVETRPIKGTKRRGKSPEEDRHLAETLLSSAKDHAENTMIVDLLRNDLSRVCEDHSVQVPQFCRLESYATVHHLVSVITGKLKPHFTAIDLFKACFPGGSITGAPKHRAMEIIAELEPTQRGPYCGSIGYISFNGDMDSSITIRTFIIKDNMIRFQTGGAIVADSDPLEEYEETLTKASGLIRALVES